MYFPKKISSSQQIALFNAILACANTTERGNVLDYAGSAIIDEQDDDNFIYSEELFWLMRDAVDTIPNSGERATLATFVDDTTFEGHPQKPPAP